jgi:hypothetical protein
MPRVNDGAQVIRFRGLDVAVGATLGTIAGALGWIGEAIGATLGTDDGVVIELSGTGKGECMSGAGGDGVIVCSGGEIGMVSGCAVCWRNMELSWSNWWR